MSQEYLSIAIWEPLPDMEAASLETMRELETIVSRKQYGRDLLYRSSDSHYVLLRYWSSEQARRTAQEDPEVLRCWARLGNEIKILKVYEKLEEIGV
ncbi:MAG TPA: hypothetical protein VFF50_11675 [Candidatus Deferrimicrobiaceae bacterium]|jgi:hypothetical protein|nr:hypothetical protein [Candidatus Deferrimicrobiaceae bacterium]